MFFSDADDNYFLSNFYPHPFKTGYFRDPHFPDKKIGFLYQDQEWLTSEHLYQALKFECETEKEKEWREIIRTSTTPTIAKYLGHQSTYARYSWQLKYRDLVKEYAKQIRKAGDMEDDHFRVSIMVTTLRAKFSHPVLREMLLKTKIKGEDSNDPLWGVRGKNMLAVLLNQIKIEFDEENWIKIEFPK